MNARHNLWTGRRSAITKCREGWRKQRRHRGSVEAYIARIDNQVGTSTWWPGLSHIQFDATKPAWHSSNWRKWPSLSHVADQGPDGVSAHHCMLGKLNLNLFPLWGPSHGCCRDLKDSYSDIGLWPLVILIMVVMNLGHGPEKDECLKFSQMQDVLSWLFQTFTAADCSLFQARCADIRAEIGADLVHLDGRGDTECVWEMLRASEHFPKLGTKKSCASSLDTNGVWPTCCRLGRLDSSRPSCYPWRAIGSKDDLFRIAWWSAHGCSIGRKRSTPRLPKSRPRM